MCGAHSTVTPYELPQIKICSFRRCSRGKCNVRSLYGNAITSLPTELAALTGLTYLDLRGNQLTRVPAEFRTVNLSDGCYLFNNPGFSCANVGASTSCCTGRDLFDQGNDCGEGLPGGPCYTG